MAEEIGCDAEYIQAVKDAYKSGALIADRNPYSVRDADLIPASEPEPGDCGSSPQ